MRTLSLFVLAIATALPAQQGGKDKPKGAEPKTTKAKAQKDDPKTAKDPAVLAIDTARKKVSTKAEEWRKSLPAPPVVKFDASRDYRWHLETSAGELVVQLLPDNAPRHVTSVIWLSRCGFYDGLTFPRIVKTFMAQGGSPDNTQGGDAGYQMDGEFLKDLKHDRAGVLSAANSGPGTDGSQFFLTFVPTPHLDGKHTVHGHVIEGNATLQAIEACGVEPDQDGKEKPKAVTIVRTWITVVDKPAAAKGAESTPPKK